MVLESLAPQILQSINSRAVGLLELLLFVGRCELQSTANVPVVSINVEGKDKGTVSHVSNESNYLRDCRVPKS